MASRRPPTLAAVYGRRRDRYLELIQRFPLRPIRSEEQLDAAIKVIDSLIDLPTLSAPEQDYLDVLSGLVEEYEDEHEPPPEPTTPGEMLQFLLEIKGLQVGVVAKGAGVAEATLAEVLSGKRKLTRGQIGKLARFFHVEPGALAFGG